MPYLACIMVCYISTYSSDVASPWFCVRRPGDVRYLEKAKRNHSRPPQILQVQSLKAQNGDWTKRKWLVFLTSASKKQLFRSISSLCRRRTWRHWKMFKFELLVKMEIQGSFAQQLKNLSLLGNKDKTKLRHSQPCPDSGAASFRGSGRPTQNGTICFFTADSLFAVHGATVGKDPLPNRMRPLNQDTCF